MYKKTFTANSFTADDILFFYNIFENTLTLAEFIARTLPQINMETFSANDNCGVNVYLIKQQGKIHRATSFVII